MSDFQNQMNRVVAGFVAQITELARRAAIDTLEAALSGSEARRAVTTTSAAPGRVRGRGAKRSPDELDKLAERFQTFVKENPGLRIEQINKQLGTTTKDLALPIRKLLAEGAIHAKGQKRSTTYFAGGGGGGGGGGGAGGGGGRKRKAKS
jgi:hypothetical protein